MTLLALLLDLIAYGTFVVQSHNATMYAIGTIAQAVITGLLLIFLFAYKGKRFGWFNFETWVHNFSLRYAIIVISFLVNAVLLFLYVLNVTGRNTMIFG